MHYVHSRGVPLEAALLNYCVTRLSGQILPPFKILIVFLWCLILRRYFPCWHLPGILVVWKLYYLWRTRSFKCGVVDGNVDWI